MSTTRTRATARTLAGGSGRPGAAVGPARLAAPASGILEPMARRTKETGRVTPKGGRPARTSAATATTTVSGRYTPPIPDEYRSSPWWVPALVLAFMGIGVLAIVLNYLSLLPASPTNWYLLGGLVGVIAGFIVATRWH